jgi:hypothetical protein
MQPIYIQTVQGNFGFDWNFTLTDSQGAVVDLTGASLTFEIQSVSDFAVKSAGVMTLLVPSAGTCQYTVQANDFLVAGNYTAQIVVRYGAGEVFTFTDINIMVDPSLPQPQ